MLKKTILILTLLICLLTMAAADAPPEPDGRVNKYVTRSELLMAAAEYVGVASPERAAVVWSGGLMARSAAMQYSVMSERLRAEYAAQLDTLDSNWVTGMSSPWVDSYRITEINNRHGGRAELGLTLETMTSAGPAGTLRAKLTLVLEGDFWRIDAIRADEGLYPYTLYRPPN